MPPTLPGLFRMLCLQHYPSILHQLDSSLPKGDIDVKMIDFGTAQLCKDGSSVAAGISGTPGTVFIIPTLAAAHSINV